MFASIAARAGVAVVGCWLAAVTARADGPALGELGRLVPGFPSAGAAGFVAADFDRDGRDDVAASLGLDGNVIEIVGASGAGIGTKQVLIVPDAPVVRVLIRNVAGVPHLLTVSETGIVHEFAGWPLVQTRTLVLDEDIYVYAAAAGDIDADGRDEIVIASFPGLHVYDIADGTQRWTLETPAVHDLLLEQMDADPALEIVLAAEPGLVIDGATQATDWSYKDGFGAYLAAGHFQSGGGAQFVAGNEWSPFMVFQSAPYSPLWDAETSDIGAIAAGDFDGDGLDEVVEGDGQWGAINIFDSRSHQLRLSIPHAGWGVGAIAAADLLGSGTAQIAFGTIESDSAADDALSVIRGSDGATLWQITGARQPPFSAVALSAASGAPKLFYGAQGYYYGPSTIAALDALTGVEQWHMPGTDEADTPFDLFTVKALDIVSRGTEPPLLAVGGSSNIDARVLGIDIGQQSVRWQAVTDSGPLADVAAIDVDGDGRDEVAACAGSRLFLFAGSDGAQLWQSVMLGNGDTCVGLMAGRFDAGPSRLLVAVMPDSVRAFDAATHLLAWTLPVVADGATRLDVGVSSREFAVFAGSNLDFYDGATRALLRQVDLGEPITAVRELDGIHHLLVAAGGKLTIVDGVSGATLATSGFLGDGLAAGNQLAVSGGAGGRYLIAAGSDAGVFRYAASLGNAIFSDGFDGAD